MSTNVVKFVPRIGDIIQLRDGHKDKGDEKFFGVRQWRVTGYMKRFEVPKHNQNDFNDVIKNILNTSCREFDFGKGKTRVKTCSYADAEYITGSGIAGCIYPIEDVIVVGRVKWNIHYINYEELSSYLNIGEPLY